MVINQKLRDVWSQKFARVISTTGTTNTPSFVKIREVILNSLLIRHGMIRISLVGVRNTYVLSVNVCVCVFKQGTYQNALSEVI